MRAPAAEERRREHAETARWLLWAALLLGVHQRDLCLAQRRQPVLLLNDYDGTSAFRPVSARPMISFWICEVPS